MIGLFVAGSGSSALRPHIVHEKLLLLRLSAVRVWLDNPMLQHVGLRFCAHRVLAVLAI